MFKINVQHSKRHHQLDYLAGRVLENRMDEGHNLEALAQSHAVGKDGS